MRGGLGGQHLLQTLEPGALLRGIGVAARAGESGHGRQRAHPAVQPQAAQQAHEADQVAARAGGAGEVGFAGRGLVKVPGDGEGHGLHADVFEPDQFALPQVPRVEIVGELDGLHIVGGGRGDGEGQRERDYRQADQKLRAFRTR